jgi:hypothetical protein
MADDAGEEGKEYKWQSSERKEGDEPQVAKWVAKPGRCAVPLRAPRRAARSRAVCTGCAVRVPSVRAQGEGRVPGWRLV